MSSLSNSASYHATEYAQNGTITVSNAAPFYSTSLESTGVSAITADTAGNITYTLTGSPDLSEVIVGSEAFIKGDYDNPSNNGLKTITNVIDSADQITVSNDGRNGVTVATAENTFLSVKGLRSAKLIPATNLKVSSVSVYNHVGTYPTVFSAGNEYVVDLQSLVLTSGEAVITLAPFYKEPEAL